MKKIKRWLFGKPKEKEKKLKYYDNDYIICSVCHKPVYMGYTSKNDSELCTYKYHNIIGEQMVYDKRKEVKEIEPVSKYYRYE